MNRHSTRSYITGRNKRLPRPQPIYSCPHLYVNEIHSICYSKHILILRHLNGATDVRIFSRKNIYDRRTKISRS